MADKYKKRDTFLVFEKGHNEPLRWKSDNTLFFAGSVDDALEGLPYGEFHAIPVYFCSEVIQKEYEERVDELIETGEIEI
jgi:hypothetical protein